MGDNWELPKPVFRSSSGSLPEDFPTRAGADSPPQAEAKLPNVDDQILSSLYAPPGETAKNITDPEPSPTAPSIVDIEPQPFISEQFGAEEIDTLPPNKEPGKPVKKKGSGSAFLLIALAILLALIGGILAVIYILFFRNPPETTF